MRSRSKITTKAPNIKRENHTSKARKIDFSQSINSPVDHILFLQRTIGNQAVQRLIKQSGVSGQQSGVGIQAKLTVGQPGDIYEHETDKVAEQVMRMPESQYPKCKESSGHPIPDKNRIFMEKRFGTTLSDVRLHTDSNAAQLNRDLNAQAFTYGRNIYFGQGRYSLNTLTGKRLLAHELTHVIQQNRSTSIRRIQMQTANNPKFPTEKAKDATKKAEELRKQINPCIWFDSWTNDRRDNDRDNKIDETDEKKKDGIHYRGTYKGYICKNNKNLGSSPNYYGTGRGIGIGSLA